MQGLLTKKAARVVILKLQKSGQKVVLTHGVFDIFHAGHAEFLREAKKCGDVLFVGLDSDAWVRHYKGEGRPIVPYKQRATVLLETESVDYVFPIPDHIPGDYFTRLYRELMPNVIVFGKNYYNKRRKLVIERRKKLFPTVEFRSLSSTSTHNQSSSKIITKIRNLEV